MIIILLPILLVGLLVANFAPGSWLSGWDNLHPEFDFGLNIQRSLFSVWQEYQGLGLLAGMGHAADLPHQLLLLLLSLVFPDPWLRQIYFFLTLALGPLGMYFLLHRVILGSLAKGGATPESEGDPGRSASWRIARMTPATMGAVFYLLNLATVQTFYTSFEPFVTHFAFLPWLFLTAILYLKNQSRKNLLFLIVVNFFAIPQGYVPTLFVVYFASLSVLLAILVWKGRDLFRTAVKVVFLTLAINAFWLLPFLYFALNNSAITVESKINQMSTEKVYLQSKEFGDLNDVVLLKGFWFDNLDFNQKGDLVYMLTPWRDYLNRGTVSALGYLGFLVVICGIIYAVRKKNHYREVLLILFLISITLLANNTPPFSWINEFLRLKLPLFTQVFRFPFTKFSILASFTYAVFFAFGVSWISVRLKTLPQWRWSGGLLALLLTGILVFFTLPAFKGHLFYQRLKVKIPQEYEAVWKFFDRQETTGRIANFPQHTFWGWNFYRWPGGGYDGSGFLWYGLRQPILDRAFDVWSRESENYYWEISQAVYSQDLSLLESILEKYQISWLMLDENVIYYPSYQSLYLGEIEKLIAGSEKIELASDLGKVKIFKVNLETPAKDFVLLAEDLPVAAPVYKWNNYDQGYVDNGNYLTLYPKPYTLNPIYYPFRSLFTGKYQKDLDFEIEDKGEYFVFRKIVKEDLTGYVLEIPEGKFDELLGINPEDLEEKRVVKPEVYFDGEKVEAIVPRVGGYFSASLDAAGGPDILEAKNCSQIGEGSIKNAVIKDGEQELLRLTARGAANCSADFWLPSLDHRFGYLITAQTRNLDGQSLILWLENQTNRKADIETYLPKNPRVETSYFIQPPMTNDGIGYSLHFDNISIGYQPTINDLGKITVDPIPYRFLTGIKLVKPGVEDRQPAYFTPEKVEHPNPSLYIIQPLATSHEPSVTLVLSQAYHKGWVAYEIANGEWRMANSFKTLFPFIFGKEIKEHVLVNNWENGWVINQESGIRNQESVIILIFWPQYLQYLGFVLMIAVPLIFFKTLRRSNRL